MNNRLGKHRCGYCGHLTLRVGVPVTCYYHRDLPNLDPAVGGLFQRPWGKLRATAK
jgi:hypothetical protein